ncbi:MAG: response regulator [Cyclobacteriaceae bacterium]
MESQKVILIIDDETDVIESIKTQLIAVFGNEFTYEYASSGKEGLEVVDELRQEPLDILITISDWLMPGMKGDEFLVKLHRVVPEAIKIMVTGHATNDAIQRAYREANLYRVIRKPWKEDELINTIRKSLEE